jgi:hypothetical protein
MYPSQVKAIQDLAVEWLRTPVTIYTRLPLVSEADAPFGDDMVSYDPKPVTVMAWLTRDTTKAFMTDAAAVVTSMTFTLRVPFGTLLSSGDKIVIGPDTYAIVDALHEATWPIWEVCSMRKVE